MGEFSDADKPVRDAIEAAYPALISAFAAALEVEEVDLQQRDLTNAVLLRLRSYFLTQANIKGLLNKVYAAPAADFFVETICFFLMVVLKKIDPTLSVASEKRIMPKNGSMRPDITVWRDAKVVAAIECKTQLGWNRDGWLKDFEAREKKLKKEAPGARMFLLVMSGSNWNGFKDDHRVGIQFFVLLDKTWPRDLDIPIPTDVIVHPFEAFLGAVVDCLRARQNLK